MEATPNVIAVIYGFALVEAAGLLATLALWALYRGRR